VVETNRTIMIAVADSGAREFSFIFIFSSISGRAFEQSRLAAICRTLDILPLRF